MKYSNQILTICFFVISNGLLAQSQYSPFFGSIYVGSGVSTVFDFNSEFNGILIPYQAGIKANKWLNKNHVLEVGFSFARRGVRKTGSIKYPQGGTAILMYDIGFYSIDIPLSVYTRSRLFLKKYETFYFLGIRNSYLPISPEISDGTITVTIEDRVFRNYNIAGCTGFGFEFFDNIRVDLSLNIFFLSLIKPEYRQLFDSTVNYYKSSLYPLELILSVNYKFE